MLPQVKAKPGNRVAVEQISATAPTSHGKWGIDAAEQGPIIVFQVRPLVFEGPDHPQYPPGGKIGFDLEVKDPPLLSAKGRKDRSIDVGRAQIRP